MHVFDLYTYLLFHFSATAKATDVIMSDRLAPKSTFRRRQETDIHVASASRRQANPNDLAGGVICQTRDPLKWWLAGHLRN